MRRASWDRAFWTDPSEGSCRGWALAVAAYMVQCLSMLATTAAIDGLRIEDGPRWDTSAPVLVERQHVESKRRVENAPTTMVGTPLVSGVSTRWQMPPSLTLLQTLVSGRLVHERKRRTA